MSVPIADTGYELYAVCETVKDLDQLYSDLGMADETAEDVMHSVDDPVSPQDQIYVRTPSGRRQAQENGSSSLHAEAVNYPEYHDEERRSLGRKTCLKP